MTQVIECFDLTRTYESRTLLGRRRQTEAVSGLNLTIDEGRVFGLLGPNGAGKTTTIRILATLLTPTSGRATVLGFDVIRDALQIRRRIGLVLGGERGLYGRLTGRQNLRYYGAFNHMSPRSADRRADELLDAVGLGGRADTLVDEYSRGMKQRLHIARGLMTDPPLLIMDEPTMGLDPIGAREVQQLIRELAGRGKTVLLSTHYMHEDDNVCHMIGIINKGTLVAHGTPSEIKGQFGKLSVIDLTLKQARPGLAEEIAQLDGVERVNIVVDGVLQKFSVQLRTDIEISDRLASLAGPETVESLLTRTPTLEEAYVSILK